MATPSTSGVLFAFYDCISVKRGYNGSPLMAVTSYEQWATGSIGGAQKLGEETS